LAVDELVGDEIADDEDAAAREAVDERQQPCLALGLARKGMNGSGYEHCGSRVADCGWHKIQLAAAARLSATTSAATPAVGRVSSTAPLPVRTRIARAPTARASRTSIHRSPTTKDRAASRPRSAAALSIRPRAGFRQPHARAYGSTLPPG